MIFKPLSAVRHLTFQYVTPTEPKNPSSTFCNLLKMHTRWHHQVSRRRLPKTPDLIYVPQIMKWLKNKLKFKLLKKSWDPDFTEGAFIYGSTR